MQKRKDSDIFCETTCKHFRCSERMIKIIHRQDKKEIMCRMVEGDECIGYKCKFAVCFYRPPALNISTGHCSLKKKNLRPKQQPQKRPIREDDDPIKYSKLLDKKLRKNFQLKDYY